MSSSSLAVSAVLCIAVAPGDITSRSGQDLEAWKRRDVIAPTIRRQLSDVNRHVRRHYQTMFVREFAPRPQRQR